ncbi:MAG: MBOAT family protein [Bacteroidetes bacterium]|nr:MAG: MBOAT family protein [Bacteroidota bacterium]
MLFSSTLFLLYFLPAFLTIYFIIPAKAKNPFTLFASILFFAWGAPKFVFVLSAAVIADFFIAQLIHKNEGRKRRVFLTIGVVFNVSVLLYFKYFNFFMDNVNVLMEGFGTNAIIFTRVALPIGISFFVFHELSYLLDVYRRVKPPMNHIINYGLYIFLFPQLIAGPIIRFSEIADQINERKFQDNIDNRILGLFRFVIGLAKKVLIANVLGEEADKIFKLPLEELSSVSAWIGALCYTFQIYFDFSGYSDMAIGLARAMGFIFPENFNHPYLAESITDFWRRWHMSLSRWMRDYLYISLGGNKVPVPRMYFNLCLVFLISGFWHGAEWTFIFWGAYHGLFLVLDRLFLLKLTSYIGKIPRIIFTFFITVIGWIFFRSESMLQAFLFLKKMGEFSWSKYFFTPYLISVLAAAIALSFFLPFLNRNKLNNIETFSVLSIRETAFSVLIIVLVMIICVGEISSSGFNPFIYFKF